MVDPWAEELGADALGKFVSKETLLKVLPNASLRWSRPASFNDPFDCNPRFAPLTFSDSDRLAF
jgi:hypothetical protein